MRVRDVFKTAVELGYRRRWMAVIVALALGGSIFEGIGLGIFLPILEFMSKEGDIATLTESSQLWRYLIEVSDFIGVPVNLATLLLVAFLSILARQAFVYANLVYRARVQHAFLAQVRQLAFRRFLNVRLAYSEKMKLGEMVNELVNELGRMVSVFIGATAFAGYTILMGVYGVMMWLISPNMTLICIVVFALSGLVLSKVLKKLRPTGAAFTLSNQNYADFLIGRLRSIRLIRLSGSEAAETDAIDALTETQRVQAVKLMEILARGNTLIEPIVLGVALVLFYLAGNAFGLGMERVLIFFVILVRLLPIAREMALNAQTILSTLPAMELVHRRLSELKAHADGGTGTEPFPALKSGISLQDVSVIYDTRQSTPALSGVSVDIPAGRMTAIVGPSGAGKSTLIDLLPRLRPRSGGDVLFDGVSIDRINPVQLRQGISYVPQEARIFDLSPAEHISYGFPSASRADIEAAAKTANAHEFIIQLENGYDTKLGDGAPTLSGGQKQRLDLARALVRRAPILILDEPTSDLDAESEALVVDALIRTRDEDGTTVIIIGHRLSMVANCDRIIVLSDGKVDACGTHSDLMTANGWYAKAFRQQEGLSANSA